MTFLCRLSDLEPTGARGVVLADGRDIIVVRSDDGDVYKRQAQG